MPRTDQPAPTPPWREGSRLPAAFGAAAIAVVLWNVPFLGILLFPLRLLTTFAHEAGHGLAAILTGGRFLGFEISLDGSGLATTAGGWRWVVLPAGYVGSAVTASTLFIATQRATRSHLVALVAAVLTALVAVLFGLSSGLALSAGLGSAIALIALSRLRERRTPIAVTLHLIAFVMAWNAVLDLLYVVRRPSVGTNRVLNDAAAFGEHVGIGGGRLWGSIWLLVVVAVLVGAARLGIGAGPPDGDDAGLRDVRRRR